MTENQYDILVLGGGPGGYAAGIAAGKAGLKVALFEKEHLGGTCLNVGCIPAKYLLDKASTIEKIRALTKNGVFRNAGCFSFKKIQAGKDDVVNRLTNGVGSLLKKSGVEIVRGEAKLMKDRVVVCNGRAYAGKHVIIATGSVPVQIPIPGAEYSVDSTAILNLSKIPKEMVVIGGGVIGLELASAYTSFGTKATVVEMLDGLFPNELPAAAKQMTNALKKRGIVIQCGAKVKAIKKQGDRLQVQYSKDAKDMLADADVVLMGVGRKANLCGVDAAALGLKLTGKGCIEVDDHMRTNLPGIYAIGDVIGTYQLAHAAYAEAETAVANILNRDEAIDYSALPRCVHTIPCFAAVGRTQKQAAEDGIETVVGTFPYEGNGMALAEGAGGTVYAVMDAKTKKTIGIEIVGDNASELISFASLAVRDSISANEWVNIIVAHPSLSEMVRESALDAFGMAIHKASK